MGSADKIFDQLVAEAERQPFDGWDFSYISPHRYREEPPSWSYRERVQGLLNSARVLLDMGTGGGEFLASLAPSGF